MDEQLNALIAAIDAGTVGPDDFDTLCTGVWGEDSQHDESVSAAYWDNDMNAALALHAALLPGWGWVLDTKEDGTDAHVYAPTRGARFDALSPTPARALLLATLKGYRATMENAK